MQQGSADQLGSIRTVESIAEHRMTGVGEMNPDLVGASGDQPASNQTKVVFERGQNFDLGTCRFATVVTSKSPPVIRIASDGAVEREGHFTWVPFKNSNVITLDLVVGPGAGDFRQGIRASSEEHGAARLAIEAVDHSQEWLRAFTLSEKKEHLLVEGGWIVRGIALGRLRKNPRRFVGNQNPPIFVQYLHRRPVR